MGKNNNSPNEQSKQITATARQGYQDVTRGPSHLEREYAPINQQFMNNYNQAVGQNTADYGNIMGGYQNFAKNLGSPTNFSFERVNAVTPEELKESYGYLREAAPGYREFAKTGGYSGQDIQELRARSTSPVRAAYGNTMMELDRARSLGGPGGAPNYIAAASRAQRELPGQMADAMTGINAELARDIRQGKLAGLGGLTNVGGTMGGLSSQDAQRQLQAALANQGADLQSQSLSEQSRQALRANQLAALGGQASLYGTTPGMASTFGNQALNSWQQRFGADANRQNLGLGYLDAQLRGIGTQAGTQGTPWWQTALGIAGTAAPYIAMSSREVKEDIKPVKNPSKFAKYLKELPLYTWKYKGDSTTHFGPIAEEFKEKFGIGDGKTLHLADVMGVVLASQKAALDHA